METAILEAPIAPERENTSPSPEFSRRLLLAPTNKDALNPAIPLGTTTRESLGTLAERNYTIFNAHATQERTAFWSSKPEQTNAAQMETWLANTQDIFTGAKDFFTNTDQGKQWAEVYKKLGLSADNIQKDSLQQFYKKYLALTDTANGGVKLFVKDILSSPAYRTADGKFDATKLEQDLPAIKWLANVFGENSAQIISSLTASEATLEEKPEELINNTDATMSTQETGLLESLSHAVPTPPTEQPVPEPETTPANPTMSEQTAPVTQTPAESTPPAQEVTQPTPVTEPTPARNPVITTPPVTTATPTETQPAAPQTHEIDPTKNLTTQVNEALRSGATTNMRFEIPPAALTNYMKTIKLDTGELKKMQVQIANGKMNLIGEVGIILGKIEFNATLVNNPAGGLVIEGTPIVNLSGTAGGFRSQAETAIKNLNTKMMEMIRSQADPAWNIASTQIVGDKLALEFKKK